MSLSLAGPVDSFFFPSKAVSVLPADGGDGDLSLSAPGRASVRAWLKVARSGGGGAAAAHSAVVSY